MKAHRRRFGAAEIFASIKDQDFSGLREPVPRDKDEAEFSRNRADLSEHLKWVEAEFAGQPEVLLVHAKLIVLIRREYRAAECYELFKTLWREEQAFLLKHLSMRWLISANDTFLELSREPSERLMAGWTVLLCNTVKLAETERAFEKRELIPERLEELKAGSNELFDGFTTYKVGHEDTLINMRRRLEAISDNSAPSRIFWEVFARLQDQDSVYGRFRALHFRPRTAWW